MESSESERGPNMTTMEPEDTDEEVDVEEEHKLQLFITSLKVKADELMYKEDFDQATALYRELLMNITRSQVQAELHRELVLSCEMNILAALTRQSDWHQVLTNSSDILTRLEAQIKETNQKSSYLSTKAQALAMRGYARLQLSQFRSADNDFQQAVALDEDNALVQNHWDELHECLEQEEYVKSQLLQSKSQLESKNHNLALELATSALSASQKLGKSELIAIVHGQMALIHQHLHANEKAIKQYRHALALMKSATAKSTDTKGSTWRAERSLELLEGLSACYSRQRDFSSALSVLEDAIRLLPSISLGPAKAAALHLNAGRICMSLERQYEAKTHLQSAREAALEADDTHVHLICLLYLVKVADQVQNEDVAMELVQEALAEAQAVQNVDMYVHLLLAKLDVLDHMMERGKEVSMDMQAQLWNIYKYFTSKQFLRGQLRVAWTLVHVLELTDRTDEMERVFQVVDEVSVTNLSFQDAEVLMQLAAYRAERMAKEGQWTEAIGMIDSKLTALGRRKDGRAQELRGCLYPVFIQICKASYEKEVMEEETWRHLEEARTYMKRSSNDREMLVGHHDASTLLAQEKVKMGSYDLAEEVLQEDVDRMKRLKDDEKLCETLMGLCVLYIKQGKAQEAKDMAKTMQTVKGAGESKEVAFVTEKAERMPTPTVKLEESSKNVYGIAAFIVACVAMILAGVAFGGR